VELEQGYSGGAVFTEQGELVGLISRYQGISVVPFTPIDEVVASAKDRGAQLRLTKPRVPVDGYRLTVGLSISRGADPAPDPSFRLYDFNTTSTAYRVDATYHMRSRLSFSAGAVAMLNADSHVVGPFLGVGVKLLRLRDAERSGGLWAPVLSAFADVGFAQIFTLADSGGYSVGHGDQPAEGDEGYVPALVADSYTTVGAEAGLRLDMFVRPRFGVGFIATAVASPSGHSGNGHYAGFRLLGGISARYAVW
jgi:hypothetical protein